MEKCYHYTIADRLVKILISGHIKVMEESSKREDYEVRLAWLTIDPKWDNTAFYRHPDDALDNAGRIRITLKSKYPSYLDFWGGIPDILALEESGASVNVDHTNWRVSPKVVPISDFEKVELWLHKEKRWEEIPIKLLKEEENGINESSEEHC